MWFCFPFLWWLVILSIISCHCFSVSFGGEFLLRASAYISVEFFFGYRVVWVFNIFWIWNLIMIYEYFLLFGKLPLHFVDNCPLFCWWFPFLYRSFLVWFSPFIDFCFLAFAFDVRSKKVILKTSVKEIISYVFL